MYGLFSLLSPVKTSTDVLKQLKPIADATQALKNTLSEYEEIKIDEENSAILESKQLDHLRANFLWFTHRYATDPYSLDYTDSFVTEEDSSFIFKKDKKDIVITIEPTAVLPYNIYKYYRYSSQGWLVFSFVQDASKNEAVIKEGIFGEEYLIKPLYSGSCNAPKILPDDQEANKVATIKLIGLEIGDSVTKIPPSEVSCFMEDGLNATWSTPFLAFREFDADYSALKLRLPNGESVLIDVETKKIIHSKQRYSGPCDGSPSQLTLTTPSSTTVLLENVWADPVFSSMVDEGQLLCLSKTPARDEVNPTFSLNINYGEGSADLGTYVFDMKTRKFKKIR